MQELAERVGEWRRRNDGGRLHSKGNRQFCVDWEHGGYHELGCMYESKNADESAELICDVFNWALDQLWPGETVNAFYGEREY